MQTDLEQVDAKVTELTAKLHEQFKEFHRLEAEIKKNLEILGFK